MRPPKPLPALSPADLARLDRLWGRHRPRLVAALRRRVAPRLATRTDPDELLARAYVQSVRRWGRFRDRPGRSGYGWLYRLALDQVIEAWRRETRGRHDCRRDVAWPDGSSALLGWGLAAAGTTPSEAAAREEVRDRMRRALRRLRPADHGILLMRYDRQMSFAAIAAVLGTTENAATVRCTRAVRRLRACWGRLYGREGEP